MELVLGNGFCELTNAEMAFTEGGVDGWALASSLLSIAGVVSAINN